ncbi:MAG: hypothetical protein K0M45_02190 [Candidatus Paracaedibacteraceae bacterium]|nr:hypothetical protein [Candidatus Paracaedibacteraceae bacterium]
MIQPLLELINTHLNVTQVEKLEGGFVSGQIYRVHTLDKKLNQNKVFYIKYLRTKPILVSKGRTYGEESNLHYLAHASQLKTIQQYIDIILPVASYEYSVKGDRKIFMILPSAEGESLSKLVQNNNIDTINHAFAVLGSSLAKVHLSSHVFSGPKGSKIPQTKQDFINAYVSSHGDLHGDNVFYNSSTKRIAFIDVETMANSFDEKDQANSPVCYDMFYMLLMSSKKFGEFMPKNNWGPFLNMFKSYIEVYPMKQRQGVYKYLIYCLQRAHKIDFVDIFKYFNFSKKFGNTELKGADVLAQQLHLLKLEHFKQLNIGRNRSQECKDIIENTYRPKGSPANSPIISSKLHESSPRLRAVTAPASFSPAIPSPKVPNKFPLPVSTAAIIETNKVSLHSLPLKVGVEVNKVVPLSVALKGVAVAPKGTSLPAVPKKVEGAVNKLAPLSIAPKRVTAAPKRTSLPAVPKKVVGAVNNLLSIANDTIPYHKWSQEKI